MLDFFSRARFFRVLNFFSRVRTFFARLIFFLDFFPDFFLDFFPDFLLDFFPDFLLDFFPDFLLDFLLDFFPDFLLDFLSSSAFRRGRKIRRYKCPCVYYNNSTAVFHAQLVGDLVFKLNPGPTSSTVRHRNNVTQVHSSRNATISRPSCRQEKRNVNNLSYVKRHGSLRDGKRLLRVNLPNHYVTCGTRSNN